MKVLMGILAAIYGLSLFPWMAVLLATIMITDSGKVPPIYYLMLFSVLVYPVSVILFYVFYSKRLWWLPLANVALIALSGFMVFR